MTLMYLFLGIIGLWLASEIAINGALGLSERFKVSRPFIGLTILAIGTDVPELFVNITAALGNLGGKQTHDFILGNVFGSSFGQAGLMLGITGLTGTLVILRRQLFRDGGMLIVASLLIFLLALDGEISRTDGLLMLVVYGAYFFTLFREEHVREKLSFLPQKGGIQSFLMVFAGLTLLAYSADMTVTHALLLSEQWGIAQSVVGALIVGIGTSLPELVTSAMAVRGGYVKMAIANLIGSTTFDMLVALGAAASISSLPVSSEILYMDMLMLIVLSGLIFILFWKKMSLSRKDAAILIIAYMIYAGAKLGGMVTSPF